MMLKIFSHSFFFCDGRLLRIEVRHGYPNPEGDDAVKKKLSFNGNVNQHQGQRERNTDNEGDEIKKRDSGAENREDDYDDLPELIEERDLKEKDGNDKNEESESEVEGKGQASESESESDSEDNEDHSDVEDENSQSCPFELFHIAIIERQERENNILIKKISSLEEEKRQLDQNISKKKEKLNTAKIQIVNLLSEIQNVKQSNHVLSKEVIKLSSAYKDLYSIYNEEKNNITKELKTLTASYDEVKKYKQYFDGENLDQLEDSDLKNIYTNLKKEKIRRKTMKKCVVCLQNEVSVVCLPCGHVCLCEDCSSNVSKRCPLDRARIKELKKVYL